jgi:metal-responsive CopG/Arc/MetJ family transcriptional regulator
MTLTRELLKQVDDFRYENYIPITSEGIRRLLTEALKKDRKRKLRK